MDQDGGQGAGEHRPAMAVGGGGGVGALSHCCAARGVQRVEQSGRSECAC